MIAVSFSISGNLRFLSHLEQLKMFERAAIRAQLPVVYTQGFNPHPVISLPLPRPVGVEGDDELFCFRVRTSKNSYDTESFKAALSAQFPAGITIKSIFIEPSEKVPVPLAAEYFIPLKKALLDDNVRIQTLKSAVNGCLTAKSLIVRRDERKANRRIKEVDVRCFIDDIIFSLNGINIRCKISGGSIRIDEILTFLALGIDDLDEPVKRLSVQWNIKNV